MPPSCSCWSEGADESGRRAFAIHSRPQEGRGGGGRSVPAEWTCHARGVLSADLQTSSAVERLAAEAWPPAGAEPQDVEELYDRLSAVGFAYGPAFRGSGRRGAAARRCSPRSC